MRKMGLAAAIAAAAAGCVVDSGKSEQKTSVAKSAVTVADALTAHREYGGSSPYFDGLRQFDAPALLQLPTELTVTEGNGADGTATIKFARKSTEVAATCTYRAGAPVRHPSTDADVAAGLKYVFESCTDGTTPATTIRVNWVSLRVEDGDSWSPLGSGSSANVTRVSAALRVQRFELIGDIALGGNPSGTWTRGAMTGAEFAPHPSLSSGTAFSLTGGSSGTSTTTNLTEVPHRWDSYATIAARTVLLNPWGAAVAVRWTAPAAGSYAVEAQFTDPSSSGAGCFTDYSIPVAQWSTCEGDCTPYPNWSFHCEASTSYVSPDTQRRYCSRKRAYACGLFAWTGLELCHTVDVRWDYTRYARYCHSRATVSVRMGDEQWTSGTVADGPIVLSKTITLAAATSIDFIADKASVATLHLDRALLSATITPACPALTGDCDGDAANGCETALADGVHCPLPPVTAAPATPAPVTPPAGAPSVPGSAAAPGKPDAPPGKPI